MLAKKARFDEIEERLERIENLLNQVVEKMEAPATVDPSKPAELKFKEGDRCRIVTDGWLNGFHDFIRGEIVTVIYVDNDDDDVPYQCENYKGRWWW